MFMARFEGKSAEDPCLVFAPHQDDETLGCGGTIVQKKRKGALVIVVFMTDGAGSFEHLDRKSLKRIRKQEALNACNVLGVAENEIVFLEYDDGGLADHHCDAVKRVSELIKSYQPKEIYLPYSGDPHPDHQATNNIVIDAVEDVGASVITYEYPIWFLDYWPMVDVRHNGFIGFLAIARDGVRSTLMLLRRFRFCVNISDVLSIKRKALAQHKSQVSMAVNGEDKPTLNDIANGEWLECFFWRYELFYKRIWFF